MSSTFHGDRCEHCGEPTGFENIHCHACGGYRPLAELRYRWRMLTLPARSALLWVWWKLTGNGPP